MQMSIVIRPIYTYSKNPSTVNSTLVYYYYKSMVYKASLLPKQILKKRFGYSEFREGQLEIINNILAKKDTIAILPTGGGKSICFQIPALIFGQNKNNSQISIVISPLISLMKDQVDALNSKGISACFINSSQSQRKQNETFELIKLKSQSEKNIINIIYVSPERLTSPKFINLIKKLNIGMIVVDEAHCISQWGDDFRPEYKQISNFYKYLNKDVVKVAFTATANKTVQKDISETLKLNKPFIFFQSFARKNLFLEVLDCQSETIKNLLLLRILNKHKNQTGIIYCSTRKMTENITKFLLKFNISSSHYHGAIDKKEKEMIQNSFINGNQKIIVATNSFGMGIDKNNIRFVVHYQVPGNIENYYQEIGRAGRDEKLSKCYCLYYKDDLKIQLSFLKNSKQNLEKNLENLKTMNSYFKTKNCRTNFILKYFGEIKNENCCMCDNCSTINISNQGLNTESNIDKNIINHPNHPLLTKISNSEIELIKKLVKKKSSYKNPTNFLTDTEICYLSIVRPKNIDDYLSIPGLGIGWINTRWKVVAPIINSN